ncbi:MAG: FecR family protein [Phenylobacterium sp.]|uniref:FecR family protein n=1 Tax=Phenylobacterium sp. TaxID=1871053 RepID=UPI00391D8BCC
MGSGRTEGRKELIAQAADWLARLDSGSADPAAFEAWRAGDPRRAAAFAEVAGAWELLDDVRSAGVAVRPPKSSINRRLLIGGGASLAAGLAAAAYLGPELLRPRLTTEVGERRALRLPDGSSVELNTDSKLSWRFTREARRVWLERGEAAFTVSPDDARPFLLFAAATVARLAGGSFNARLRSSRLDLLVLAGQAAVTSADHLAREVRVDGPSDARRIVAAGPSGVVDQPVSEQAAQAAQAWRRGEIVFDGQPLSAAIEEYNRYLPAKLVVRDPALGATRLGGRFMTNDVDGFLAALNASFGIVVVESGSERILTRGR